MPTNEILRRYFIVSQYFYAFIGIVSIEENNLKSSTADYSFATLTSSYSAIMFIEVTSWMMFALGVFFIFFGLCCCQRYHAKVREEYTNRMAERKRMFGESGLRSNSFDVPMKRWDDSKGTMT